MLKFNIKEHKLEELEKYGFIYCKVQHNGYEYYTFSHKKLYIDIPKKELVVELENDDDGFYNDGMVNNKVLGTLYNLIKDGLVIKE